MNLRETIKKILKEEFELPLYLKRRLNIGEDEIIDMLKKYSVRAFQPHKKIEVIVGLACGNTAYEIIDAINPHMSDEEYRKLEQKFKFYLQEKYRDFIKEYLENYFSSQGDDYGTLYLFWKHEHRNGGNGFTNPFPTWNKLLMEYGWWFPDLDWPNLKKKLDSMADGEPLLIKRPGDKNNTMNYYFSLFKMNKKLQTEEQTEGELTEKCWKGYTQKGMKTMFGKRYPNCVKKTK